jgi:predicted permease
MQPAGCTREDVMKGALRSLVVAMYSGGRTDARAIARKVLQFPPFIALCVALVVAATPGWPTLVEEVLAHISASLAPSTSVFRSPVFKDCTTIFA